MVHCCILGCRSDSHHTVTTSSSDSERKCEKITFHRFPRDIIIRNFWIKATGRYDWQPTKQTRICSKHFENNCFRRSKKVTLLSYGSIPKLFTPLENDMENYMQYKIMGSVKRIKKKPNCIPSKFDGHVNKKYKSTPSESRPVFKKRQRMPLITEAEGTVKGSNKRPSSSKPGTLSRRKRIKQEDSQIISSQELTYSSEDLKSAMKEIIAASNEGIETRNRLARDEVTLECRACYQKFDYDAGLVDLFQPWNPPWNGMADTIAEDLSNLTSIEVSSSDSYSRYICQMCHQKLLDACNFVANVRLNDRVFREKIEECSRQDTIWPKPIQVDKDVNSLVPNNSMVVEVKQEILSEDEADVNGIDDIYKEADFNNFEIKVEPEEILEQPPIQITVNGTISHDQFAQNSIVVNGDCKPEDQKIEEVKVKEEPKSEDEDSEMVPDLPLECMLCTKNFNSVSGLKAHVLSQHSYKSVKRKIDGGSSPKKKERHVCATCRSSFATSTDLMVHETRHNAYACYVCNAKFDTFELLTKHRKKCKSAKSKAVSKPKTLEDVKRPQLSSPQLSRTSTPESMNYIKNEDMRSSPNVEVHLKIHSISEKTNIVDSEKDFEIKTEPLDSSFSEDEVIN